MVYRKRTIRKRRPSRRPSRGKVYSAAASQLYKDVQKLKNFVNVEFKYFDTALNSTIQNTGTFQFLNHVSQGDTDQGRDGSTIRMKSIQSQYIYTRATTDCQVRVIYFCDLQATGPSPTLATILSNGSTYLTALRNLSFRNRFLILKDKQFNLTTEFPIKTLHWYKKIDMKVTFDDTSDGSPITNHPIYMLVLSDQPIGATTPTISGQSRVRFIDN